MSDHKLPNKDKDIEDNKFLAAIGYIWFLFLIPLFLKRNSKFAQFHAKQGLVIFVLEWLGFIPIIGWFLYVVAIVLVVLGIKAALEGKYWEMPIFGKYAKKINL